MTAEEKCRIIHGDLIIPNGHVILRSMYQFADTEEVYAFLYCCKKECCSVHFQNEDVSMDREGNMNVPSIAVSMYMHLKENPKIVEAYLSYLVKSNSGSWAIDHVECV